MAPEYQLQPIGLIHSPFKEKFAIPRQPGLAPAARSQLVLQSPFNQAEAVRDLEQFSHLWLTFIFHQTLDAGWRPTVRPPRMGGNARTGVFATRATHRPNGLGLSVVELERVECKGEQVILHLLGSDLLHGTPVVDIKPYLPYVDSVPDARAGFAQEAPAPRLSISFTDKARQQLARLRQYPDFDQLIEQVLAQDPRPAYKRGKPGVQDYGVTLHEFNIRWQVEGDQALVLSVEPDQQEGH